MSTDVINYAGEIILSYKSPRKKLSLVKLTNHMDVARFARSIWYKDISVRERILILLTNPNLGILAHFWLGMGGVDFTPGDKKLINYVAVKFAASGVVIVHNHPSMNLTASESDMELTRDAMKGLNILGIRLVDHIIITPFDHLSIRQTNESMFNKQLKKNIMKKTILLLVALLLPILAFSQINSYKMNHFSIYDNKPDGSIGNVKQSVDDISTVIITNFNKGIITVHLKSGPEVFVITDSFEPEEFTDFDGDAYTIFPYQCIDDEGIKCTILVCSWYVSGYDLRQIWIRYSNITLFYQGVFTHRIEKTESKTSNTSYEI